MVVIRVVKKEQFWVVISVVISVVVGWLLGWLKKAVLGGYLCG